MITKLIKAHFEKWILNPFVSRRTIHSIPPMPVTIAALVLGFLSGILLYYRLNTWAVFTLILSGLLDTLDGSLARYQESESPLGCSLDIVSDRIVEAAVIIGLISQAPDARAILGSTMIAMLLIRQALFMQAALFIPNDSNKSFFYIQSIMDRLERFIFLIAMIIFSKAFFGLAVAFNSLMVLSIVLMYIDFYQRFKKRQNSKNSFADPDQSSE